MIKYIKYALVVLLSLPMLNLQAQDFHFSQYYAAPLTLNPTLMGQFNGQYRINLNYRSQWSTISSPYQTAHVSGDFSVSDRWSLGAYVLDQKAGNGGYNNLNAMLGAAYDLPLGIDKYNHLVFGVQGGIINKQFDVNKFVFEDQIRSGSSTSTEVIDNPSTLVPDVNAGIMFYDGNPFRVVNYFIGATAFHLLEPNQSTTGQASSTVPMRFLGHAGIKVKATRTLEVQLQGLANYQKTATEYVPGLALQYYLTDADAYLIGGASLRWDDAVIPYIGIQFREFMFGFSYDYNVSKLDFKLPETASGLEFSLCYIRKPKVFKPKFVCPRI